MDRLIRKRAGQYPERLYHHRVSEKSEIRARVERLLAGSKNSRDLDRVFAWLRFRSYGRSAVKDIGDFAGHLEDRDRGLAWAGASRISTMLKYHIPRIEAENTPKILPGTKAIYSASAIAALDSSKESYIQDGFGISKAKAKLHLQRALSKVDVFIGRTVRLARPLNQIENDLLQRFGGLLVAHAPFDDEVLTREFGEVLCRNSLISPSEEAVVLGIRDFVAVFAVEKMQRARIKVGDAHTASLRAGLDADGNIIVGAHFEVPLRSGPVTFVFPIFVTKCRPEEWVEDWAAASIRPSFWDSPFEINLAGKLDLIR
jgi:hypothetical protein